MQFCWVKIWCKVKYEFHQIGIAIIAALTIIRFYLAAIVQTIACRQSWTRGIPEHSSDLTRDYKRRSQFWLHNTNQCWTYRVCLIKSEEKKTRHIQSLTTNRKSTFSVRSSWNLVKLITYWGNHLHKVSWRLDKNCGFFSNDQFLSVSGIFLLRL